MSLSLYDAVMLRTLHNNRPYVFQACLRYGVGRFVSKRKD